MNELLNATWVRYTRAVLSSIAVAMSFDAIVVLSLEGMSSS